MNDEVTRLKNILSKIQNPQISLKECKSLYQSANINWVSTFEKIRKNEEVKEGELKTEIFVKFTDKFSDESLNLGTESEEVKKNLTQLSDEKFDFAEIICNIFLNAFGYFCSNWNSFTDNEKENFKGILKILQYTEVNKFENEVKEAIEEFEKFAPLIKNERSRREQLKQNSPKMEDTPQNDTSNNANFSDIQSLTIAINNLQNQIQNLEKESQKPNSNSPVSQSDQQKIAKLKNQLKQLQNDLQNKQNSSEKTQINNTQTADKGFNWLYVVIPGGVLILVMAVIIAYLVGKRNKKE